MSERSVLIVGACGGIGRATALQQAGLGARLVLTDLHSEGLRILAEDCSDVGASHVSVLAADVAQPEHAERAVAMAVDNADRIDGLVYAAGITGPVAPLGQYPGNAFEDVLKVNLVGAFHILTAALPALRRADEAPVVLVGSTSSIRGRSLLAGYVASKHALLGLVRTACLECADTGVRVNAVLPGPVDTPMLDELNRAATSVAGDPDVAFGRSSPQSGLATPGDIAHTISYLLSPAARHVRGAAWVVDGGGSVG